MQPNCLILPSYIGQSLSYQNTEGKALLDLRGNSYHNRIHKVIRKLSGVV